MRFIVFEVVDFVFLGFSVDMFKIKIGLVGNLLFDDKLICWS